MFSAVEAAAKNCRTNPCRASAPLARAGDTPALQFVLRRHRGDALSVENADTLAHSKVESDQDFLGFGSWDLGFTALGSVHGRK